MKNKSTGKTTVLLPSCAPRGLRRAAAAEYIGVSPAHFDTMVASGEMPPPRISGGCRIWDRIELDGAFSELPVREGSKKHAPSGWEALQS